MGEHTKGAGGIMGQILKSCPFCGGDAEFVQYGLRQWSVECPACKARIGIQHGKFGAADVWNKRSEKHISAISERN